MAIQKKLASVITITVMAVSMMVEPVCQQVSWKSILTSVKNIMGTPKTWFAAP
jgi:hypothetical protein